MRFSPLGMVGDHTRLVVRGRLMRAEDRTSLTGKSMHRRGRAIPLALRPRDG